MKKFQFIFYLWIFSLSFSNAAKAELSQEEKKEFIDQQLAQPFPEGQVHYRWQPDEKTKELLDAGEMTQELYRDFTDIKFMESLRLQIAKGGIRSKTLPGAGPGMYISEDIHSSHMPGQTIIRVKLGPHFKYIDKEDLKFKEELHRKGISWKDVERLSGSHIAFKYTDTWLVVRGRQGVQFKSFSFQKVTLGELETAHRKVEYKADEKFKNAIKSEFAKRARRDITVTDSSMMRTLDTKTADSILDHHKKSTDNIKTSREGANLLKYLGKDFSPEEREEILSQAMALADTVEEKIYLLNQAEEYLSKTDRRTLIQEIIPHIKTAHQIVELRLRYRHKHLLTADMEQIIVDKMRELPVTSYSDGEVLYGMSYWIKGFLEEDRQRMLDQTISHIESAFDGALFLRQFEDELSDKDRQKIMNKILASVDSFTEGKKLLIMRRMPNDFSSVILGTIWSTEEIKSIVRQSFSRYKTMDESIRFFENDNLWHQHISLEASEEIINTLLSPMKTNEEGINFLVHWGRNWHSSTVLSKYRQLIINKFFSCITTIEEGFKFISALEDLWDKADINKQKRVFLTDIEELVINHILSLTETAEGGAKFLSGLKDILSHESLWHLRAPVVKHILSLIQTAEKGAQILKDWGYIFSKSEREFVVSQMLPHIPAVEEGVELLRSNEGVFFETEKYQVANKTAKTGKELALFREFLSDESYESIKKVRRQERIECMKAWGKSLFNRK